MESVADLRTQLCEEEHNLCDWHGYDVTTSKWVDDSMELRAKMDRRRSQ